MTTKKKSYYKPKKKKEPYPPAITPELMAALRADILKELKAEDQRKAAELEQERKNQQTAHQKFLEQMYASKDPWVELQSWADTPQGVKVELEWNDAFIDHLREAGVTGINDDAVVQQWVAVLLRQITDNIEESVHKEDESKLE